MDKILWSDAMLEEKKCLLYMRDVPGARAGSPENVWLVVFSDEGCLADAAAYGGMQGSDGKHKLCEDGIIVDGESAPVASVCKVLLTHLCAACHVFKVLDKSTHPWTPELSTGHKIFDPRLVFITMTNHEDQHSVRSVQSSLHCTWCS